MWSEGTIFPGDLASCAVHVRSAPGFEESVIRGVRGPIECAEKELEGREGCRQRRRPQGVTWGNTL